VFKPSAAPLEFMDLPLDETHPVVWAINRYDRPTGRHYDIHTGLEIGIVLAGGSRRLYRQHLFEVRPGNIWLVAPWEPHGVQILRPKTTHLVLGMIPEFLGVPDVCSGCDWMRLFNRSVVQRPQTTTAQHRRTMLAMAKKIVVVLESNDPNRLARLRIAVQELLLDLMAIDPTTIGDKNGTPDLSNDETILAALRLVERDPGRKITLADAARASRISRTRFAEQFHTFTGLTFAQYLIRRRLRGVVGDLRGSNQKLQVIARRWGFADPSHLVRVFRKHAGCTPQNYRRESTLQTGLDRSPTTGTMPKPRMFV
jgi:AraC-like DNA-binding protein